MQSLLSQKNDLESNLTANVEKEKVLEEKVSALKDKINQLLLIAAQATGKAQAEHNAEMKEMQSLLSQKKDLESNLTANLEKEKVLKEEVSNLKGKISELLSIAEKATIKATDEHDAEVKEMQTLLSQQKALESNLTTELESQKLLVDVNLKLTEKLDEKKSLEENLTNRLEEIQAKVATLETEKIEAQKANEERESRDKEDAQALDAQKHKNSELKGKITELLAIAEKATTQAQAEHDIDIKEMQGLLSQTKSLESNLTSQLESKELLEASNLKLKEELEKERKVEANLTKILEETQAKVENLEAEKAAAQKAEVERLADEERLAKEKAEAEAAAQKAEVERLAEEERLAKEKAEAEAATQKAEVERLAEEERLAKENEAKAAAQKVEVERLAEEERLSKEKAEAEAAALVAATKAEEKSMLDIFALTKVEFKYNSMQLTTKSRKLLDNAATVMKEHSNYHYNIQGHTDNRGKDEYNLKLSAQRADKVKEYLVSKGVEDTLLTTEGLGSLQPIASNDTKEGRLINRRVVFEIIK